MVVVTSPVIILILEATHLETQIDQIKTVLFKHLSES